MSARTWILGKQQKFVPGKPTMRDILETDPDGRQQVLVVVAEVCAVDVLAALRTTYRNGSEDQGTRRRGDAP